VRWTEHYQPPAYGQPVGYSQPAYAPAPERPLLPAGTPIYSVFIWLVALLPLVTYIILPLWNPFAGLPQIRGSRDLQTLAIPLAFFGWAYFAFLIISWISYGLIVVFAWRDYRQLERVGVVRPFHWAWAFLSGLVYVIGRSVIVRRVAPGRGFAPIWVSVAVFVVGLVVALVWMSFLFSDMVHMIPAPGTFSGGSGA
jgi:hypothetical protein